MNSSSARKRTCARTCTRATATTRSRSRSRRRRSSASAGSSTCTGSRTSRGVIVIVNTILAASCVVNHVARCPDAHGTIPYTASGVVGLLGCWTGSVIAGGNAAELDSGTCVLLVFGLIDGDGGGGRGLTCDGTSISRVCDDGIRSDGHREEGREIDE